MARARHVPAAVATRRARVAGLVSQGADPERVADAQRELRGALAVAYIEKILADTPPLTVADRAYLAALLTHPRTGEAWT